MRPATGESESDVEESQIAELEQRLSKFRVQVSDDMTIRGNAWQGLALNIPECTPGEISIAGACCFNDGTCAVETEDQCNSDGGTYQGNGTSCSTTGACCLGDGSCLVATEPCCSNIGGTYQGNGTDCDPNPCSQICCFKVSASDVGLDGGVPYSCILPETLISFNCCDILGSSFIINQDCDDPINPPGSIVVTGNVIFNSSFPGEWELQILVSGLGSLGATLDIGPDSCIGGPVTVSGDAFPPDPSNSSFITGSMETVDTGCPTGACCDTFTGDCHIDGEFPCGALGDLYQGDGTVCSPNPC